MCSRLCCVLFCGGYSIIRCGFLWYSWYSSLSVWFVKSNTAEKRKNQFLVKFQARSGTPQEKIRFVSGMFWVITSTQDAIKRNYYPLAF